MEMSLNNSPYHAPLSSSSSRQSLHKVTPSRPGTASSRQHDRHSRGQLPEGRPSTDETHQPPGTVTSPCQDGVMDETKDHPEEGQEQPVSHPAFQPFFTLIEDAHTSDYYHPTVHYIFSDDDTDIVAEAAIRSLAAQQEALSDSKKDRIAQIQASNLHDEIKDSSNPDLAKSTLLPPPVPGVRENYVILDIEPSSHTPEAAQSSLVTEQVAPGKGGGTRSISSSPANASTLPQDQGQLHPQYHVTEVQSFSSTWQVLNTEVVPAPTFENSNPGESPGHGLMLKIRGTGGLPIKVGGKDREGTLEEMMDQFAKRMSELQVIIDAAEAADSKGEHDEERLVQHPFSPDTAEETTQTKRDSAAYAEGEHS